MEKVFGEFAAEQAIENDTSSRFIASLNLDDHQLNELIRIKDRHQHSKEEIMGLIQFLIENDISPFYILYRISV